MRARARAHCGFRPEPAHIRNPAWGPIIGLMTKTCHHYSSAHLGPGPLALTIDLGETDLFHVPSRTTRARSARRARLRSLSRFASQLVAREWKFSQTPRFRVGPTRKVSLCHYLVTAFGGNTPRQKETVAGHERLGKHVYTVDDAIGSG